jgi:hypothetical protein
MIMQYNKNKNFKIILKGFINVYNIEQNELEHPLAREIHQIINYDSNLEKGEINNVIPIQNTYNKNYVSKTNLLIHGIFNNGNYVNRF